VRGINNGDAGAAAVESERFLIALFWSHPVLSYCGRNVCECGALLICYRNGAGIPVLIGGPVGLIVALRLHRRHVQGVR
jgi:hypothetical protein